MAPSAPEETGGEPARRVVPKSLREVELDAVLARRTPKALRVAALVATLLLALVPVWLSLAGPLEAALDQSRDVLIQANLSAGTVSVDGRAIGDRVPLTVRLAPGRHAVALQAPAFRRHECRLTVPASGPGDTCVVTGEPSVAGDGGELSIAFGLSAADLLPGQLPAVRAALDDGLVGRLARLGVDIAPGEWYGAGAATGDGAIAVQRTAEPLRAVPAASLNGLPGDYACGAPLCAELAGQNAGADAGGDVVWRVKMGVTLGWDFTTESVAPTGQVRYRPGIGGPMLLLALAYDAKHGWRLLGDDVAGRSLETQVAAGLCVQGEAALLARYPERMLLSAPGPATLRGCALKLRWAVSRHRAELAGEVICRFGAPLAADASTQVLFPGLALASQDERTAAGG